MHTIHIKIVKSCFQWMYTDCVHNIHNLWIESSANKRHMHVCDQESYNLIANKRHMHVCDQESYNLISIS